VRECEANFLLLHVLFVPLYMFVGFLVSIPLLLLTFPIWNKDEDETKIEKKVVETRCATSKSDMGGVLISRGRRMIE